MRNGKNVVNKIKIYTFGCLLFALTAANTLAEEVVQPTLPSGFIPLPPRAIAGRPNAIALPKSSPRFIALGPHNFKSVLRPSHSDDAVEKPLLENDRPIIQTSEASAPVDGHRLMTTQQALQIISIFSPDQ
jgi:hypothetical protein